MYKFSKKIQIENQKVFNFASHHSQFHYLASDCNLNLANFFGFIKEFDLCDEYIEKSLHMYPENKTAIQIKKRVFKFSEIIYFKTNDIEFEMIKSNKELISLDKEIKFETEKKNFKNLKNLFLNILKTVDNLHFDYHLKLAEMYFDLAKVYFEESLQHEAKIFLEKALETDKNNPNNDKYKKFKHQLT